MEAHKYFWRGEGLNGRLVGGSAANQPPIQLWYTHKKFFANLSNMF